MLFDDTADENRRIDALTNQPRPRIEATIRQPSDVAALREAWAKVDAIPVLLARREDGVDHSWGGLDIRTLLSGDDSGGRFTYHDVIIPPGASFPLSYQTLEQTFWWVVQGEVEVRIGDRTERAFDSGFAYAPENTRQSVSNPTSQPARLLLSFSPAGAERAFEEAHAHWLATGDRDPAAYAPILTRYGFGFDDRPLENDGRVNLTPETLPAVIRTEADMEELRERWSRLPSVPKLLPRAAANLSLTNVSSAQLLNGEESSGRLYGTLITSQPGYCAAAHHQPWEDEMFYVVEGEFEFQNGNVRTKIGAGAFAMSPRYATHWFLNTSDAPVRLIGMNAPAGHERAFDMHKLKPTPEEIPALMVALGWRLHEDAVLAAPEDA